MDLLYEIIVFLRINQLAILNTLLEDLGGGRAMPDEFASVHSEKHLDKKVFALRHLSVGNDRIPDLFHIVRNEAGRSMPVNRVLCEACFLFGFLFIIVIVSMI